MSQFDSKSFNPQAFNYRVGRVPNLKMNEIKKSRALAPNPDIRSAFNSQSGTAYARIAARGLIDGEAVNYDGKTDIIATGTKTFEQGIVVVGRAKAWVEKDFSYDITGGVDFIENIASQVAEYKDGLDQNSILATLKGVFGMTGIKNKEFVDKHTSDISKAVEGDLTATTLNTATNKACGANKKKISLVFMHSDTSTGLENLRLIEHLKYTDANGIQRDLALGTWNGRLVVIDDELPTSPITAHYIKCKQLTKDALKVVVDDATPGAGEIKIVDTKVTGIKAGEFVFYIDAGTAYTTYALGIASISYEDIGAKKPSAMSRNEEKNGGEDTLYMRQRKVFSPVGISYEKKSQVSLSPTDIELALGTNWTLVNSGEENEVDRSYINHKSIAICKIVSRG